jgi:23S rRNA A2030 N6-methylase RlmJ
MDLSLIVTDELTAIREVEHAHKNYALSDAIRAELDKRGSFVIDTAKGQVVYHMGEKWANKRTEFLKNIKQIDLNFK